ncbi:epsilon subunit of f1f0-atp synthase n-terminal domain-containing protein [Phaffia rhodozyma]|uniref:ATP synthase subunit delta, mitochondrial n=1 Tax=Phaffia rhodozyma TaxID=264483 RepID=A0A0F7SPQ1_PHARH|nr:epsilon subunit of f1f0-atp synthase n-terminal domain-containing protein [Phaffia rhodozyma]
MFALRPVTRAALPLLKRSYAEAAPATASKLKLSLVLPHQTLFSSSEVTQVNIPASSGNMGILSGHVPTLEALTPGLVEVIEGANGSKKWFISSGFASVHPNNELTINAVEAYDIADFDASAVKSSLAAAKQTLSSTTSEYAKAEAQVEVDVLTVLEAAVKA